MSSLLSQSSTGLLRPLLQYVSNLTSHGLILTGGQKFAFFMPSSPGVYHWASIMPASNMDVFAGWWNTFAWVVQEISFDSSSGADRV